ncbi:MAG: hypothetical protein AAF515_22335 [Pseudomonadota bacterium]
MALVDVGVIVVMLVLVTWMGHRLSGHATNRSDFFTGGAGVPWWAVSASIIATVVSSVTFISVPAAVFRIGGDLTYFQMILGLALGKVLTAWLFARPYYESRSVATTYDYIGARMAPAVGRASLGLGLALNLINTAVKLLTTALVLSVMTDWSLALCALVIIAFSVLWSALAGLKTVIWTDFLLFVVFALGAVYALLFIYAEIDLPLVDAWQQLDRNAKTALFDLSVDPGVTYTLWAGIVGSLALSVSIAGNQGTLQRVRACRSVRDAKKAFNYSALFYALHVLILGVGCALWLFYSTGGVPHADVPAELAAQLQTQPDRIFPHFIMTEIPVGVSGLLIAAIFAAGISTLDSALAEVADVSVASVYEPLRPGMSDAHYLLASRLSLALWAVAFFAAAMFFSRFQAEGLLNLTFKLPNYLTGAMFGTILLARLRIGGWLEFCVGFAVACAVVWLLQDRGVAFLWWCPASGAAMFAVSCAIARSRGRWRPELSGVLAADGESSAAAVRGVA